MKAPAVIAFLTALGAGIAFASSPAAAQPAAGSVVLVSDIHFDPFAAPALARALAGGDLAAADAAYTLAQAALPATAGKDTNPPLLASALAAIAVVAASADFVIVSGDLLAHDFQKSAATLLGIPEASGPVHALAANTTHFVLDALADAAPGKPIIVGLGNNDSECGDYRIEPRGSYLASTLEMVRQLAGAGLTDETFAATYGLGGWYAARHPTIANGRILVLNDVLWSARYEDACGASGTDAGTAMMAWLSEQLAGARSEGGRIWLVRHIPSGIDPYSTLHSREATCPARIVPFLKEPFASALIALLVEYADTIDVSFSGHVHYDDYRLITDAQSLAVGVDKIVPAISPIFGQNPGFQVLRYDTASGAPIDFDTWYLPETETPPGPAAAWEFEYRFTEAYGQPGFSAAAVERVSAALSQSGTVRDTFSRLYPVSRGALAAADLPAYVCAIRHLDPAAFTACHCGG